MDVLQLALILLVVLLGVLLSILGFQVFLILRDLKVALNKIDKFLDSASNVTSDLEKPIHAVAEITEAVGVGVKLVKSLGSKSLSSKASKTTKKIFKRR